ncbi:peroxidase family protein [Marinivivus vitaminiproducens]|uniref:peroxidase family protein n=1 Tax=Marinivivus vitaminiproducens TaxID=3035935 RepID=UPI00279EAC95|nr:peroxidase family protein [Geminicoccaceae bacterium SCSIO 64248]
MATQTKRHAQRTESERREPRAMDVFDADMPRGIAMSGLIKHGGLYLLADETRMEGRLADLMSASPYARSPNAPADVTDRLLSAAKNVPENFFYHLVGNKPYKLHSSLVSYITLNKVGITYSEADDPSPNILGVMTFVGQFIDHDLTLNAMNLFNDQRPEAGRITDDASPTIDLDSVYGPRLDDDRGRLREIPVNPDGTFVLTPVGDGFDVPRATRPDGSREAKIGDKRNDENQIILQIHILLMRLHNCFVRAGSTFEEAQRKTILHWQSFVATEYLPLVARAAEIDFVLTELIDHVGARLRHQPERQKDGTLRLRMPHEFAIGFRFGHSQLRSSYELRPGNRFALFSNIANDGGDLQGGRDLDAGRVIDWPFFVGDTAAAPDPSNTIDTTVTDVVFDLPESTIPDDIRLVGNLPFRNLARSDALGLCAGEELADIYGIDRLAPDEVDSARADLFRLDGGFRTPLWYYLLREAEVQRANGAGASPPSQLGTLGSRLIAEVVLSAIYYGPHSLLREEGDWTADVPTRATDMLTTSRGRKSKVALSDIAAFVLACENRP